MRSKNEQHPSREILGPAGMRCLAEFEDHLMQERLSNSVIETYGGAARHFAVWLALEHCTWASIDDSALRRFQYHNCKCPAPNYGHGCYKRKKSRSRSVMCGVVRFAHFLEQSGRIPRRGILEEGQRQLTVFLKNCAEQHYSAGSIRSYRSTVSHFLTWLHWCRMPLDEVTPDTLKRFMEHDCLCPGQFKSLQQPTGYHRYIRPVEMYLQFLTAMGLTPRTVLPDINRSNPALQEFRVWLRQHRGVSEATIHHYEREVTALLSDLGTDPALYDARRVRESLLSRFENVSRNHAQQVTTAIRMYLRFLVSSRKCAPNIVNAVPTHASWNLSTLPRYISMEKVERVIASCDLRRSTGLRDRAILLLLARLGLRAGDVLSFRLNDLDWANARLRVCGKTRRATWLPLPQDVGDSLLEYFERARPRVIEDIVFLGANAPHRPFAHSGAITAIVGRALRRAKMNEVRYRGANLLRHSAATGLLRSGASLNVVGALLRHRSTDTSQIYAKVDVDMLQEVAQPWIGGAQ